MLDEELSKKKKLTAEQFYSTWNVPLQDGMLFVAGLIFTYYELVRVAEPRPAVLMFLAGFLGIPFASQADRYRNLRNRLRAEEELEDEPN